MIRLHGRRPAYRLARVGTLSPARARKRTTAGRVWEGAGPRCAAALPARPTIVSAPRARAGLPTAGWLEGVARDGTADRRRQVGNRLGGGHGAAAPARGALAAMRRSRWVISGQRSIPGEQCDLPFPSQQEQYSGHRKEWTGEDEETVGRGLCASLHSAPDF